MAFLEGMGIESSSIPLLNQNWGFIGIIIGVIFSTLILSIPVIALIIGLNLKKKKKYLYRFKIVIFMQVNGKIRRIGVDNAREMFVPNSNISLFFLKSKKIYLPRATRAMGENEFWYKISDNGEWVNYDLSADPDKDTFAIANYDHRDTRYAYTNLKEIIKRNYSDKAIVWWKEYSHVISFIIIVVVTISGLIFIISRLGNVITQLIPLAETMKEIAEIMKDISINNQNVNSGIAKLT